MKNLEKIIKEYIKEYCEDEQKQDLLDWINELTFIPDSITCNNFKIFANEEHRKESNYIIHTKNSMISFCFSDSKCYVNAYNISNLLSKIEIMRKDLSGTFDLDIIVDYLLYPFMKNKNNYFTLKNILVLYQIPNNINYELISVKQNI